jgi:hypothetical protein
MPFKVPQRIAKNFKNRHNKRRQTAFQAGTDQGRPVCFVACDAPSGPCRPGDARETPVRTGA